MQYECKVTVLETKRFENLQQDFSNSADDTRTG